jgi:hypothetical protein
MTGWVDEPLFPELDAGPKADDWSHLSPDARRTRTRLATFDLGIHPITRKLLHPDAAPAGDRTAPGLRCDGCTHLRTIEYHDKTYTKCDAVTITHGPGTDTRRWYPACTLYAPPSPD